MNTINSTTLSSSNLTPSSKNSYNSIEMKSSFLVADILDKKENFSSSSKQLNEDEEKIDVEENDLTNYQAKLKLLNDSAINLSSKLNDKPEKSSSPNQSSRSNSVETNLQNSLNIKKDTNSIQLIDNFYTKFFENKQQNFISNNLDQYTKNFLNDLELKKSNLLNQVKAPNNFNDTMAKPFDFYSIFNSNPHLFAQSLEAMAAAVSTFSARENYPAFNSLNSNHNISSQIPSYSSLANNISSNNLLIPSTSQLSNTSSIDHLKTLNDQQLQFPNSSNKDLKRSDLNFEFSQQNAAIDLIKQLQNKMKDQFLLSDESKINKNFPTNPLLYNSSLTKFNENGHENTINKLCSNINLQQIIYQHQLQNHLQKNSFTYQLPQNKLGLINNDQLNSQQYLINNLLNQKDKNTKSENLINRINHNLLTNEKLKQINSFENGQNNSNEEDEDANGLSRTNSPASSSHSGAISLFNNNENSVQMTTFHPSMDYTWVCHSKQLQRKRTVFTPYQRTQLEKTFIDRKYISKSDRVSLAKKIGLNDSQIKVWFINRRTKWRNDKERKEMKKKII